MLTIAFYLVVGLGLGLGLRLGLDVGSGRLVVMQSYLYYYPLLFLPYPTKNDTMPL